MRKALDLGIAKQHREKIVKALSQLLADTYTLYLKTHNFHWNVESCCFYMLHEAFEQQYKDLSAAVDAIAERIRQLGARAPASFKEYLACSKISEAEQMLEASAMLDQLLHDHAYLTRSCREVLDLLHDADDDVTEGLLGERMKAHEETAWMLNSTLDCKTSC